MAHDEPMDLLGKLREEQERRLKAQREAHFKTLPLMLDRAKYIAGAPLQRLTAMLAFSESHHVAVKLENRCPRCSTPSTTTRDLAPWESAAVEALVMTAPSSPAERWSVVGRKCPDAKCGKVFLEYVPG